MDLEKTDYDLVVSIVVYNPLVPILQQTIRSFEKTNLRIALTIFDNSKKPLEENILQSKHPLVYHFNGCNLGYGAAHNKNLKPYLQKTDFVLILNPDVFFESHMIDELLLRMQNHPTIGLSIPKICHPGGDLQMVNRRLPRPQDYVISFLSSKLETNLFKTKTYKKYLLGDIDTDKAFLCPTTSGCFMLFKKQAFAEVNGFDERFFLYMEDTDLSRRVCEKYQVVVFSDLVAYHHWSRGAYKSLRLFLLFTRSIVRYFNKWGWIRDPLRERLNTCVDYFLPNNSPSKSSASQKESTWNPSQIW